MDPERYSTERREGQKNLGGGYIKIKRNKELRKVGKEVGKNLENTGKA